MTCPYIVDVKEITSVKGCKLTESQAGTNLHYLLCSSTSYNSDYTKCPFYREGEKKTSNKDEMAC